jgi:hypothetical protein
MSAACPIAPIHCMIYCVSPGAFHEQTKQVPLLGTAAVAAFEIRPVVQLLSAIVTRIHRGTRQEHLLAAGVLLVLLVEGLAAIAPLTGSDAMHCPLRLHFSPCAMASIPISF